jgi:hypothetical protein
VNRETVGGAASGALLGLLALVLLVVLTGCSSLGPAKVASNTLRDALHRAAPVIERRCVEPFSPDRLTATDPEARMLEAQALQRARSRSGCTPVLIAYDDARTAHMALHATIGAIAVGECVGVSRSVDRCNLDAAMAAATRAAAAVYERTRSLGGER